MPTEILILLLVVGHVITVHLLTRSATRSLLRDSAPEPAPVADPLILGAEWRDFVRSL